MWKGVLDWRGKRAGTHAYRHTVYNKRKQKNEIFSIKCLFLIFLENYPPIREQWSRLIGAAASEREYVLRALLAARALSSVL